MTDSYRSSIDHRYAREGEVLPVEHDPAPTAASAHPAGAIAIGIPGAPGAAYGAAPGLIAGGVLPGVAQAPVVLPQPVVVPQPVLGLPIGNVTIINTGGAGAPCPICGKPLGEAAKTPDKGHEHGHGHAGPPPSPRFSKATPEVFRDGFKPLWDAAQAEQASFVVVSGCGKLLDVLLRELEGRIAADDRASRVGRGLFRRAEPEKPTFAKRIEKLQDKGLLLKSTVSAAKDTALAEVLNDKIDPGAVTAEMARRYVQLLWQIADQGFEQPQWAAIGEPPKAIAAPPEAHGHGHGHDHGHGHGHGHDHAPSS
jgi:hypothetical protein